MRTSEKVTASTLATLPSKEGSKRKDTMVLPSKKPWILKANLKKRLAWAKERATWTVNDWKKFCGLMKASLTSSVQMESSKYGENQMNSTIRIVFYLLLNM